MQNDSRSTCIQIREQVWTTVNSSANSPELHLEIHWSPRHIPSGFHPSLAQFDRLLPDFAPGVWKKISLDNLLTNRLAFSTWRNSFYLMDERSFLANETIEWERCGSETRHTDPFGYTESSGHWVNFPTNKVFLWSSGLLRKSWKGRTRVLVSVETARFVPRGTERGGPRKALGEGDGVPKYDKDNFDKTTPT